MLSFARSLMLFAVLFVSTGGFVCADVLTLANGDKLKGKLIKNVDDMITFKSDILGEIIVPTTKASVEVDLTPEQKAALAKAEEEKKKAEAELAAKKPQPKKPKSRFNPVDFRMAANAPDRATKVDDTRWINSIDFGLTSLSGRDDKLDIALHVENNRRTQNTETRFINDYIFAETDGVRGTDKWTSNLRFRRNFTVKTFFQSNTRYTRDKIRSPDTDAEQGLGLGRTVYARKTIVIAAGTEVAVRYRSYMTKDSKPDETVPVCVFFQDLSLTINSRFRFKQDFSVNVNPDKMSDQKYNFYAELRGDISNTFNVKTAITLEYDKARLVPDERYSQRVTTSLGYVF